MMKGFKRFFIYLTLLILVSISLLIIVVGSTHYVQIDIIKLNAVVQTVKENWEKPEDLSGYKFDMDFLVLGDSNEQLYSSSDKAFEGIKEVFRGLCGLLKRRSDALQTTRRLTESSHALSNTIEVLEALTARSLVYSFNVIPQTLKALRCPIVLVIDYDL